MGNENRAYLGQFFNHSGTRDGLASLKEKRGKKRTGGRYHKGERINAQEAIAAICAGKPLFWAHKIQNAKWLINSQISMIVSAANHGILYAAVWVAKVAKKTKKQEEIK